MYTRQEPRLPMARVAGLEIEIIGFFVAVRSRPYIAHPHQLDVGGFTDTKDHITLGLMLGSPSLGNYHVNQESGNVYLGRSLWKG